MDRHFEPPTINESIMEYNRACHNKDLFGSALMAHLSSFTKDEITGSSIKLGEIFDVCNGRAENKQAPHLFFQCVFSEQGHV